MLKAVQVLAPGGRVSISDVLRPCLRNEGLKARPAVRSAARKGSCFVPGLSDIPSELQTAQSYSC